MTRKRDRRLCLDATIKRGAECNTDHHLLRVKWKTQRLKCNRKVKANSIKGFDVSKLMGSCNNQGNTTRETFLNETYSKVKESWRENNTIEEKWANFKTSVVNSALRNLGPRNRRQPDWFAENEETVSTMLKERNHLYQSWLTIQKEEDKDKFKKVRAKTRKHLWKIKEDWFKSKAELVEKGRFNGRLTWQCIKDLQH